ncbi:hypothetical protein AMATHDRAFT_75996 [Amanita thiersii Skay4041]|uniref:Major facilitator superfamily (MFS) profile domain-containing protein n=1 Tax=Amanita thiersii Skay4041 TaxID=703135 RepID=A0A2A9NPZ0_9AGAR|nr:hypothetical protein AMATHDRAFT_75996 [Amanita thiersii Skay4041]
MARAVPTNIRAIQLAVFIAFGFLFGYDIGVISGCLIMPDFIRRFGEPDGKGGFVLSSSRQSIITSLLSAGGALGQAFTSDRFGRRGSILIWSAIFTIGVAVQTGTTFSVAQITIGRFISGLGVGALSGILYNGETSPKALRGTLLVLYQLQIIIGLFLSYILDLATHSVPNSASWRVPVGLQMVWGLILLSGIFFLPESPRHLLGLGKRVEACKVVSELNGVPQDDPLVEELVEELEFGIKAENEGGHATWLECFSTRNNLWKRTGNGMMLQFIQQLNGQNFYYYYGDTFFQSAGTRLSPYVIQVVLGAVSVVGTVPSLILIETWGRRQLLLTGALLQAACSIIAGLVGHFTLAPANTAKELLTHRNKQGGESFPLRVRPKSIALGSATNWIWNFLLSFFAPRIAAKIGPLILLIFFGMLLFGFAYVYLFVPETKGLSLEEVDELYRSGVKPWNSAGWKPHLNDAFRAKAGVTVRESSVEKPADAA